MVGGVNTHFAFRKWEEHKSRSAQLSRSGLGFDMDGEIQMLYDYASGSHLTQREKALMEA